MGCLKLQAEENYTTLKVVYSVVGTRVLGEQQEKNKSVFLEVVYSNAQSNGGWDNSKLAMDIGGGIYGALRAATTPGNQWLGNNGKYNNNSWGGNRYTGSRSGAFSAANTYRWAGRATVVGAAIIGGVEVYNGYQADGDQFGYNAQLAAATTVGTITGGWAGAEAGIITGGIIGGAFGGIGAIPGAIIGGFIGGFLGGYTGGNIGQGSVNYYHRR